MRGSKSKMREVAGMLEEVTWKEGIESGREGKSDEG